MCYTCGCKLPYEDHGDKRNIIEDDLVGSGKTKEIKNSGRKSAKHHMMELLDLQKAKGELGKPRKDYN
jgi:hypothetical protein